MASAAPVVAPQEPVTSAAPAVVTPSPAIAAPTIKGAAVTDAAGRTGTAAGGDGTAQFDSATGKPLTAGQVYAPFNAPSPTQAPAAPVTYTGSDGNLYDQATGALIGPSADPNTIRTSVLNSFQNEIDATNAIYAQKLAEAKTAGLGRVGNATAIEARSGNLGSDFGAAQTDKVNTANSDIESGIQSEQAAAIASITNQANTSAQSQIDAKVKAQQDGLDSYLKFLAGKPAAQQANVQTLANSLVTQGVDPTQIDPAKWSSILSSYGVNSDDVLAAYKTAKASSDTAAQQKALDDAKEENQSLPASAQEYEYAKKNGYTGSYTQYQDEDANRKLILARAGRAPTAQEDKASAFGMINKLVTPSSTGPIKDPNGVPYTDANGFFTPVGFKNIVSAAAEDGLTRADILAEYPGMFAKGGASAYGLTPTEAATIGV